MKLKDLTGQRFGRLVVLKQADPQISPSGRKRTRWLCQCDCGATDLVLSESLLGGKTLSCGCYGREMTSKASIKDLTGQKIGRLTVLERASQIGDGKIRWLCKCDCGKQKIILSDSLNSGATLSCGCYIKDKTVARSTRHGKRYTRLYDIYCGIKKRCYNVNSENYKHYGNKGIVMCDKWLNDFMAFYEWSLSHGYKDELTIDRLDSKGNYEPSNCQWITRSENTRRRNIEYWGQTQNEY